MSNKAKDRIKGFCTRVTKEQWKDLVVRAEAMGIVVGNLSKSAGTSVGVYAVYDGDCLRLQGAYSGYMKIDYHDYLTRLNGSEGHGGDFEKAESNKSLSPTAVLSDLEESRSGAFVTSLIPYRHKEIGGRVHAMKILSVHLDEKRGEAILEGEKSKIGVYAKSVQGVDFSQPMAFIKYADGSERFKSWDALEEIYEPETPQPLETDKKGEDPIKGASEVKLTDLEKSRKGAFVSVLRKYMDGETGEEIHAMLIRETGRYGSEKYGQIVIVGQRCVSDGGSDAIYQRLGMVVDKKGFEGIDIMEPTWFIKHSDRRERYMAEEEFKRRYAQVLTIMTITIDKGGIPVEKADKSTVLFKDANGVDVHPGEEVYMVNRFGQVTPILSEEYQGDYGYFQGLFTVGVLVAVHKDRTKAEETAKETRYWTDALISEYKDRRGKEKEAQRNEAANDTFGEQTLAESVKSILEGKERVGAFEKVVAPLIEYLNENHDPHHSVIVTPTGAELVGGVIGVHTMKYVKD